MLGTYTAVTTHSDTFIYVTVIHVDLGKICTEFRVLSRSVDFKNLDGAALDVLMLIPSLYVHTRSKSMDQPGKVANPARGQLNKENTYFPVRVRA